MTELIDTLIAAALSAQAALDAPALSVYRAYSEPLPRHYAGEALEDAKRKLWEALGYRGDPESAEERALDAASEAA